MACIWSRQDEERAKRRPALSLERKRAIAASLAKRLAGVFEFEVHTFVWRVLAQGVYRT